MAVFVAKADIAELDRRAEGRQRGGAGLLFHLGMRVEHVEDPLGGSDRLLQVRVDATELLRRAVHQQQRRHEREERARRHLMRGDLPRAVHERDGHAHAADQLHQRRQARERRRHFHVRAEQAEGRALELCALVGFGAKRLHDAMAGEGLDAQVRQMLERFLAAPCRPAHAPSETDERIDDQWRDDQARQRQPRVDVEQPAGEHNGGQRLSGHVADRFRHGLLHLADVVADTRHQLSGRPLREERGGLPEDVAIERVAQVHHDALADAGHHIRRHVRPDALDDVHADDAPRHQRDAFSQQQRLIDDGPHKVRLPGIAGRVDRHRGDGANQPPPIRLGVREQALEWMLRHYSVNRYFNSVQTASMPSRHVIFLPSS